MFGDLSTPFKFDRKTYRPRDFSIRVLEPQIVPSSPVVCLLGTPTSFDWFASCWVIK